MAPQCKGAVSKKLFKSQLINLFSVSISFHQGYRYTDSLIFGTGTSVPTCDSDIGMTGV
jgi:hypothetical protein